MGFSRTRFGRRLFLSILRWTLPVVGALVIAGYVSAMGAALATVRRTSREEARPAVARMLDEMQALHRYAWGAMGIFAVAYLAMVGVARRMAALADELERLTTFSLHNARAPLARIQADAQAVADGTLAAADGANAILQVSAAQLKVIADYTNIVRNFAGFAAADKETFDLAGLVGCLADFAALQARHLAVVRDLPAGELTVRAHRPLVAEIVGNLLDNAVKYTDAGEVRIALARARRGVRLVVADTGCGMDRAVQKRMYERFYRADATSDRPGNGLGLATVRAAVGFYGGTIACASAPGRGTAFTVHLPLKVVREKPVF